LQSEKLRILAYPYAQAIAGEPRFMRFHREEAAFVLEYVAATAPPGPASTSLVHLSAPLHYPRGFRVWTSASGGDLSLTLAEGSLLAVAHTQALAGQTVVLCVVPCEDGTDCGVGLQPGSAGSLGWWHPCGLRTWSLGWPAALLLSTMLLAQLALLEVLWQRRGGQDGYVDVEDVKSFQPLCQLEETPRKSRPTPFVHSVPVAVAGLVFAASAMVCLNLPFQDEAGRWCAWLAATELVLLAMSVLSGLLSPILCTWSPWATVLWRLSHWLPDGWKTGLPLPAALCLRFFSVLLLGLLLVRGSVLASRQPWVLALRHRLLLLA